MNNEAIKGEILGRSAAIQDKMKMRQIPTYSYHFSSATESNSSAHNLHLFHGYPTVMVMDQLFKWFSVNYSVEKKDGPELGPISRFQDEIDPKWIWLFNFQYFWKDKTVSPNSGMMPSVARTQHSFFFF